MSSEIKVSSVKAKDGTAGISIADSTGNVSLSGTLSAGIIGDAIATTSDTRRLVRVSRSTNTSSVSSNTNGSFQTLFTANFTATSGRLVVILVNTKISIRANYILWGQIESPSKVIALNSYSDNATNGHISSNADFMIAGSDVGTGSSVTYNINLGSNSDPAVTLGGDNSIVFMEFI